MWRPVGPARRLKRKAVPGDWSRAAGDLSAGKAGSPMPTRDQTASGLETSIHALGSNFVCPPVPLSHRGLPVLIALTIISLLVAVLTLGFLGLAVFAAGWALGWLA